MVVEVGEDLGNHKTMATNIGRVWVLTRVGRETIVAMVITTIDTVVGKEMEVMLGPPPPLLKL